VLSNNKVIIISLGVNCVPGVNGSCDGPEFLRGGEGLPGGYLIGVCVGGIGLSPLLIIGDTSLGGDVIGDVALIGVPGPLSKSLNGDVVKLDDLDLLSGGRERMDEEGEGGPSSKSGPNDGNLSGFLSFFVEEKKENIIIYILSK
jgi:hypothetical protein